MGKPFDIITVPDFAGARQVFEARTLLFLASWMEYAGEARSLPLHIACVGDPPERVRRMAERAGAILSRHEPVELARAHTANKLRGLEVEARTERLLLVDTDIVFLGDLSPLRELPDGLAAAPGGAAKVSIKLWQRLYPQMGLDFPRERMPLLRAELDMPPAGREGFAGQNTETAQSPPYFNSGVVLASWRHGLRPLWQECLEKGAAVVDESEPGSAGVLCSDQAAFALAVASLRRRGIAFRRLPDTMHVRWGHLYRGKPAPGDMCVLHTTGMMAGVSEAYGTGHHGPLDVWCERTRSKLASLFKSDLRSRPLIALRRFLRGRRLLRQVRERLLRIHRHQIEGVV